MLPAHDSDYLKSRYPNHSVDLSGGVISVIVPAFPLGAGFHQSSSDLLLRLAPGYPDVPPDMWWFSPAVQRLDGRPIPAAEVMESHFNKSWQRWSRHLQPGQWRSGIDSIESYLSLVRRELATAAARAAA